MFDCIYCSENSKFQTQITSSIIGSGFKISENSDFRTGIEVNQEQDKSIVYETHLLRIQEGNRNQCWQKQLLYSPHKMNVQ